MEINTTNTNSAADALFSAMTPSAANIEYVAGQALSRGIDAYSDGDYEKAIRDFKLVISFDPYADNAIDAFDYLGDALEATGKTTEAMKTYREAIAFFPTEDGFNTSLGNLLFSEGKYQEALEQYSTAVQKNTSNSENIYSLGQAYLTLGQYKKAEEQFKRSIQMSPNDSAGYYALGQTYRQEGKYTEAEKQLEKALAIEQDFAGAHYELGMLYVDTNRLDKAGEELEILADEEGTDSDSYMDLNYTIKQNTAPRMIAAYAANLNIASGAGTQVSTLDSSLATANARKNYTLTVIFDKDMDITSVQNIANWTISRSTSTSTGGLYNWGMKISSTEISLSSMPINVVYDSDALTAKVTFKITQNASADGTIDLSHLVFKFKGTDVYGNSIDTSADEYNYFSKFV